ncbi:hypothetical protein GF362_04895 [Candidatus Dojkabacteria bacterium]|nr:hypothetical protein [Candidatus Dojkabacteria bacterium]
MLQTQRLNINLIPSDSINKEVIKFARKISRNTSPLFILDNKFNFVHLTLYSPAFPKSNLKKILLEIEQLSSYFNDINSSFTSIDSHKGYIEIKVDLSPELFNVHKQIIKKINPLRNGYIRTKYSSMSPYFKEMNDEQIANIKRYGMPNIMNLYRPHITLIRLHDFRKAKELASELKWRLQRFKSNTLGVFDMGPDGTCTHLIKKFKLGVLN